MITIPLFSIFFIYLAYLVIIGIFSFINMYHLFHGGAITISSFSVTFIIFALSISTVYFTFFFLSGTDWQQPLTLWNNDWVSNIFATPTF